MPRVPLAEQMRPKRLRDVVGQSKLIGRDKFLSHLVASKSPTSMILWGPPGTGKTTLARIIAEEVEAEFIELSAVTSGKKDVERVIDHARQNWNLQLRTILFVDEIHRFNKAQQDAFLPHVESGLITLIGATTENPSFEVIQPLLSRTRVLVLEKLTDTDLVTILKRALKQSAPNKKIASSVLKYLAAASDGDARKALGTLELLLDMNQPISLESAKQVLQQKLPAYDKTGDAHYDTVSAFIKSMRGSDVSAALYYMSRMLQAGEDPKFIARRMVIFASEDIGLAGNGALSLAVATHQAVERIGLPEAEYALYHCATALSQSKKSREVPELMMRSKTLAGQFPNSPIPLEIRNAPTGMMKQMGYGKSYEWEAGFVPTNGFLPDEVQNQLDKDA